MTGIYKITNKMDNKAYIGKALNIQERWLGHKNDSFCSEEKWNLNKRHEQTHFHRALRKYGEDAFVWEIIEECEPDELNEKEKYWISFYNTFKCGYNMTLGGDGYSNGGGENSPGSKITQTECDIIKEKLKKRWTAKQIQEIIPNATIGIISAINRGKTWYDPNQSYPINSNDGNRKWSDEEALRIKNEYVKGTTIKALAKKYNASPSTISDLVNNRTYSNLPNIQKSTNWKTISPNRKFTAEEVKRFRELAKTQSMLSIYKEYNIELNYAAFRNMIKGITYKDVL